MDPCQPFVVLMPQLSSCGIDDAPVTDCPGCRGRPTPRRAETHPPPLKLRYRNNERENRLPLPCLVRIQVLPPAHPSITSGPAGAAPGSTHAVRPCSAAPTPLEWPQKEPPLPVDSFKYLPGSIAAYYRNIAV